MKKISKYLLGAFCWFNVIACQAVEKFEVLPDLPDPLAYAVQPAQASTITGVENAAMGAQTVGQEPSIISVVMSLGFVILLIYFTGILYAKLNKVNFKTLRKQQGDFSSSQVSVISTTQLGNNKTLHVVELDGKRMLIGASTSAIQLIKDLGSIKKDESEENYSHIEIPNIKIPKIEIPKIEIPSINFSKLVTKSHKGLNDIELSNEEKSEPEEVKDNIVEHANEEETVTTESSEVIIDSLFSISQNVADNEEVVVNNSHKVDPEDFALYKKYLS